MSLGQPERRAEVRCAGVAERICWTRDDVGGSHTGWVNDTSRNGVAFITPRRDQPSPGEQIELTFGAGGRTPQHTAAQVLRTEPYDRYFSLVACKHAGLS
jgi:hypothetical protein